MSWFYRCPLEACWKGKMTTGTEIKIAMKTKKRHENPPPIPIPIFCSCGLNSTDFIAVAFGRSKPDYIAAVIINITCSAINL